MRYEITIQQKIKVEAASRKHAKKLAIENPPKAGVVGAGSYDGKLVSCSVYAMPEIRVIRVTEKDLTKNKIGKKCQKNA